MVDLNVLAEYGITTDALKALWTSDKPSDELEATKRQIAARIQDGMSNNFATHKVFYAIDQAWNTPFRQISPTLVGSLANRDDDPEVVAKTMINWGLTHMMTELVDPKTGKKTGKYELKSQIFNEIVIPLVRAYVTIRWSKLVNDRNLTPYHKFEPLMSTPVDRARCDIITSRIQAMATQFGYPDIGKQICLKMLLYATSLQFIQEEWYKEEQEHYNEKGEIEAQIVKEGLRYHLPHPTRAYYDPSQPLSSLNTDSGISYCGYWRIQTYGWVQSQKGFWNTDRIAFSDKNHLANNPTFFQNVYPCVMQFPQSADAWNTLDREDKMAASFYTSTFKDTAVTITEHFEKLIPKDAFGAGAFKDSKKGDYKHPVWFRFVVASDHSVCYCAPLPGTPATYYGYDSNESLSMNASLALEVIPFQDQVSNLTTQTLLSTRQNLANLTFVNTDMVDEKYIKLIEGGNESQYRKLNLMPFSGRKFMAGQNDVNKAFGSVRFPQLDTQGTILAINTVLNILERVLVMSAMEVASAASHEQTAEEVRNINQTTSTRVAFTGIGLDRGHDAWKKQLYTYTMAYGSDTVYAALPNDGQPLNEATLKALGFTTKSTASGPLDVHVVTGKLKGLRDKTAMQLEYFASTREFNDRANNPAMAAQMMQTLAVMMGNQVMIGAIGPEQAITLVNHALEMAGLPRDFKLRFSGQTQDQTQQQMLQLAGQVKQLVEQTAQQTLQQVSQSMAPVAHAVASIEQAMVPIAQEIKATQDQTHANSTAIGKITEILDHLDHHTTHGPGSEISNQNPDLPTGTVGGGTPQTLALPAGMPNPAESAGVPTGGVAA